MKKNESENKNSCANPAAENGTIDVRLLFDVAAWEAEAIDLNDDEIEEAEKNEDFEIDMDEDERYSGDTFGFADGESLSGSYTIIRNGVEGEWMDLKLEESNYYTLDQEEESLMRELGIESRKGYLRLWSGGSTVRGYIRGIKEFDPQKLKILTSKYVERFNGKTVIEIVDLGNIEYDGEDVEWEMDSDAMGGYDNYVVDVPTSDKK